MIPWRYRVNTSSFTHYWTAGVGAELLKKLDRHPDLARADLFIPYLFKQDDAGDAVVQALHQQMGFAAAQQMIEEFLQGNEVPKAYSTTLNTFFAPINFEPAWLNRELMQKGVELSQRSGISGLVSLRDYCLMGGYESAAINKPLIYTGALKKGAVKRLAETVEFWVDITGDGALAYGEIGFRGIIKTRMIHSFARINILKSTDWDNHKWGIPLNSWDMLATNLGFSLVYLVGLRKLGIVPLADEISGLFHLWKYVGYLLGVPLELIPENEQQAIEALYFWTMTQADGDDDSKAMAHALQEESLQSHYPPSKFGRKMMREIHLYYNHYLLGNYSCDLLKLDTTWVGKVAHLNIWKNRLENRRVNDDVHRQRLVKKGRKLHERIKRIYLLAPYGR
ncbi:hypothetical protein SAMN05216436_102209 [bacterium A37T11]|nr:hypothetical protein SAMN05216436_102209 [bacterium A37T11]